jgi:asparagine synthase (glutamine-hydrolysing)
MSGIAGIYNLDGRPVEQTMLRRMAEEIAYRGPDGIENWIGGSVGFAHLMFRTTPESLQEKQPLRNEDGSVCLTMDGRIDNRLELKAALQGRGFCIRDESDAELVLRSYEFWADECPKRLLGDFAFAIWDARRRRLFCARDHVGVRPFYFHRSANFFVFASEIRSLLSIDAIPRRLNESKVVDYLVSELDREDKESTFYADVQRLPAGHSLTVTAHQFAIRDYWNLQAPPELELSSMEEYGEAFRDVFVEAVRCRLRTIHPIGATLSGGLDSSAVVCVARDLLAQNLKEPLHTISLLDGEGSMDPATPYIDEVIRGGGLVPHMLRSDQAPSCCRDIPEAMVQSDDPFDLGQGYFSRVVFAVAKAYGIKVLMDGIDGDLVMPHSHYLATLLRTLKWRVFGAELAAFSQEYGESRWRSFVNHALVPTMPSVYLGWRRLAGRRSFGSWSPDQLITKEFAHRMDVAGRREQRSRILWKASRNIGTLHAWSFSSGLLPFVFESYSRMAALAGVETRHPFSDRRVIDFFLSLPVLMKLSGPLEKMVMRTGLQGVVPKQVCWRKRLPHPDSAFLAPLLKQHAFLVDDILERCLQPVGQYVNLQKTLDCYAEYRSNGSIEAGRTVWQVGNLAKWLDSKGLCHSGS